MQQALSLRYPQRVASEPGAHEPEEPLRDRLHFVLVDERWGADGPVPWNEVFVPGIERFLGPVALYRTDFSTGEFEYPWVAALVLAKEVNGEIELDVLLNPNFTSSVDRLSVIAQGACAPSEARKYELARGIAMLYALGVSERVTKARPEGPCLISEFHLYGDEAWRYVAVDFDPLGVVRSVHEFNPKDEADSALRAEVCSGPIRR